MNLPNISNAIEKLFPLIWLATNLPNRGENISNAIEILNFSNKKSSNLIKKVLESAIANSEHNQGVDIDKLILSKIFIDEGPRMKRIMPRAKGRANHILKRSSHITVIVTD